MIESESIWETKESHLFLNPRLPTRTAAKIQAAVDEQNRKGVVWLKSSGTESGSHGHKLVALPKVGILAAAQSVNRFFKIGSRDVWLNPLPDFHIGGLSIDARTFLSGARMTRLDRWDPVQFHKHLQNNGVTIVSLVPTQVYDLIDHGLKAPPDLRIALVGGGPLANDLYFRGRALGWPLVPSYGMTETAALVAAAPLTSLNDTQFPKAEILPHVLFKETPEGYAIESSSLFLGFLWIDNHGNSRWQERPKPFVLDDRIQIEGNTLKVLGRASEVVKILGETVNLLNLKDSLQIKIPKNIVIAPIANARRGFDLHLIVESKEFPLPLDIINQDLMPFEKIKEIHFMENLPRSPLGKIAMSELKDLIFH